jgi:hypothetical protein
MLLSLEPICIGYSFASIITVSLSTLRNILLWGGFWLGTNILFDGCSVVSNMLGLVWSISTKWFLSEITTSTPNSCLNFVYYSDNWYSLLYNNTNTTLLVKLAACLITSKFSLETMTMTFSFRITLLINRSSSIAFAALSKV